VLYEPYRNYDLRQAYLVCAGVPPHLRPNYDALAKRFHVDEHVIKSYFNLRIQGTNNPNAWTLEHGWDLRRYLQADPELTRILPYVKEPKELQLERRRLTMEMTKVCKANGIRVIMNEHDGLVVDRDIPKNLIDQVFPPGAEFRKKGFCLEGEMLNARIDL
jgi:hypothetical protein